MQSAPKKIPIERSLDKMFDIIEDLIPRMPKDVKHTWGQKLFNLELTIYEILYNAKYAESKHGELIELRSKFFLMTKLLQRAHNKQFIPTNKYTELIPIIGNVERQLNGWIKSVTNDLPESDSVTADGECV